MYVFKDQINQMVREITVIKKPRDGPIQDFPIAFPPLQNLHLDLMENKRKLKKNLPIVQIKKKENAPVPKVAPYSAEVMAGVAGVVAGATVTKKSKESGNKENFSKNTDVTDANAEADDQELEDELAEDEDFAGNTEEEEAKANAKDGEIPKKVSNDNVAKALSPDSPAPTPVPTTAPALEEPEPTNEPAVEEQEDDPYAGLSPEEREVKEREEYIWRFRILKKQHKNRNIPEFTEHDDVIMMKQTYERTIKEIRLENSVEDYRTYLTYGFMAMEFGFTQWLGIDFSGFASHQMLRMDKYDRLLIELGEKSYNSWGSSLPVEIRLIGFIIFQAATFYLGKIIADKAGSTVADFFKNMTGQTENVSSGGNVKPEESDVPKKKMRGPSVKVADLKKKIET